MSIKNANTGGSGVAVELVLVHLSSPEAPALLTGTLITEPPVAGGTLEPAAPPLPAPGNDAPPESTPPVTLAPLEPPANVVVSGSLPEQARSAIAPTSEQEASEKQLEIRMIVTR
jgi:hypothetical protein